MRMTWWRGGGSGAPGRGLSRAGWAAIAILSLIAGLQEVSSLVAAFQVPGVIPGDELRGELLQIALWVGRRGLRRLGLEGIDVGGGCGPE